jgi:hypothetical protein
MLALSILLSLVLTSPAQSQGKATATQSASEAIPVGVPRWSRELVLEGSLLEVRPPALETALILRIDSASPHGTAWRYDFEYYGLEPGSYDLVQFLRREDGSEITGLEPIAVLVETGLPPGQVLPHKVQAGETPELGGYTKLLWTLGGAWLLASALWLLSSLRSARGEPDEGAPAALSLAELLAPLIERGMAGELPTPEQAQLELMLIAVWRKRLDLEGADIGEALRTLKAHPEAGPLLLELERWLHSPDASSDLDITALLKPYHGLSMSEWDEAAAELASAQETD